MGDAIALEITRHFDAPPELVFDAWLARDLAAWLPPAGASAELRHIEARQGGGFLVHMHMPDGRGVEISGKFVEVLRPSKLVLSWTGNYNNVETSIIITVHAEGHGTHMTLVQKGFPDPDQRDGYHHGWNGAGGALDKLAHHLAKSAR